MPCHVVLSLTIRGMWAKNDEGKTKDIISAFTLFLVVLGVINTDIILQYQHLAHVKQLAVWYP